MIEAWCDGSATYGHGPACIGVVVAHDGKALVEVSEHVGPGTNNVAELRALRRAMVLLEQMFGLDAPATIYADSQYAIGQTTCQWKVNTNHALVAAMRAQYARFTMLRIVHVRGHAGDPGNELADWLAGRARHWYFLNVDPSRTKVGYRVRPEL